MHPSLRRWLDEVNLPEAQRRSLHALLAELMRAAVQRLVGQTGAPSFTPAVMDLIDPQEAQESAPTRDATRFEWLCRIGLGGTAEVWRVFDPLLQRPLALKTLRADLMGQATSLERFNAEVHVTAALSHPGVIPVHESGVLPDGRPYFLMREIVGCTFAELLRSASRREALDVVRRVAQTLAHAHARGITHRDLKPDNVMVGPFGEVVVLDWGLVQDTLGGVSPAGAGLTQVGDVLGTPAFMAPEQARGEATGPWTDIWAVGALVHTTLTGRQPWGEGSADVLAERARSGTPHKLNLFPPDRPLEAIVHRAMAPLPQDRYGSVAALAEDLGAWLDGRPVSIYPYSRPELARRWLEQHRGVAATGALALVLLSVGSLAAVLLLRGQKEEALRALAETRVRTALVSDGEDNYGQAGDLASTARLAVEALEALEVAAVPAGGPEDPRPDLWGILVRAQAAELPRWVAHMPNRRCLRLAWSPQAERLACAGLQSGLWVWEADGTGQRQLSPCEDVRSVSWADEQTLWVGCADARVVRWDLLSGSPTAQHSVGAGVVNEIAAMPDGGVVFGGEVWNLWIFHPPDRVTQGPFFPVIAFGLSPDGLKLAAGLEMRFSLWDMSSSWQSAQELNIPSGSGITVATAWSPDGRWTAWVGTDGEVHLVDTESGQWRRSFGRHRGTLYGVAWQDADTLYTGAGDGTVRAWTASTGRELLRIPRREGAIESLAVGGNNLALCRDGGLEIWSLPDPPPMLPPNMGSGFVQADAARESAWVSVQGYPPLTKSEGLYSSTLVAIPLGHRTAPLLTLPMDLLSVTQTAGPLTMGYRFDPGRGHVQLLIDLRTQTDIVLPLKTWGRVMESTLAQDGSRLVTLDDSLGVHVYDVQSQGEIAVWPLENGTQKTSPHSGLTQTYLIDSGRILAECWSWAQVHFRDALTGEIQATLEGPSGAAPEQWAFSPDEQTIAWAMMDGRILLQDRRSGALRSLRAEGINFAPFAFLDEGRLLASGGTDGRLYLWEVKTGALRARFRAHDTRVWRLSTLRAAELVSMGFARLPRRWDFSTLNKNPRALLEALGMASPPSPLRTVH